MRFCRAHSICALWLLSATATRANAAPLAFHVVDSDPKHPSGVVLPGAGSHAVRDSTGRLVATYTLATQQATQYYNFARTSSDDGATWSTAPRTESQPDSSNSYALVVDAADVLNLGFGFNVGTFATRSIDHGASWAAAVQLLDGGWGAWDYAPALAIDTNGKLHAVFQAAFGWSDPPYNIRHTISTDSGVSFSTPTTVTQIPNDDAAYDAGAQQPALEAGPNGQLFLVYNLRASATNSKTVLRQWDGSSWSEEVQLSTAGAVAAAAYDLGVDSQGLVQVAWTETRTGGTDPVLVYATYNPQTKVVATPRVISATGDGVAEVTLGVYAQDAVVIGYSVYASSSGKYGGVKLLRSSDAFATAELVSTHSEARSPSLRYQYNHFSQATKADLLWVEVNDVTGGEMLVHAIAGFVPGQAPPSATPTGYRVQAYGPRIVNPGQDATFLVQYENGRDHAIDDAVVSVSLPLDFPYVRSTHGGQLLAGAGAQDVYWRLGTLAPKARGFLGVTLRIPWAIPEGAASLTLRAGAQGGIGTIVPSDLPTSSPKAVTQSETLDSSAVALWLAADSNLARVVEQAEARGYLGPYSGDRNALGSGKQVTRLFMVSPQRGTPAIVTSDGVTPYMDMPDRSERVVADASGGYRVSQIDGSFEPFGTWAVTHSPSVARCQLNCSLSKVPGWAAEAASKTVGAISTGIDCVTCARTKGSDKGACAKCANAYHDVPGVGQAVDLSECLSECLKNPSQYVCTQDKRECSNSWGATFAGWAGKATVAVTYCNTTTGTYDPISRDLYCDRGEVCQAGACVAKEDMCGSGAKTAYEDATCSLTPFEVVPAHDPNEQTVTPTGDVVPGTELKYTIEYENVGSGTAMGVFVLNTVSESLDLDSVTPENNGSWTRDARLLTWNVGDIAPSGGGKIRWSARVPSTSTVGTSICNLAEVHFPSAGEVTPTNPVCNTVAQVAANPLALQTFSGGSVNAVLSGSSVGSSALDYRVTRAPLHGTLSGTPPALAYTAQDGFVGQDDFEFVVAQALSVSAPARVTIEVASSPSDTVVPEVIETQPTNASVDVAAAATPVADGRYLPVITATLSENIDPKTVTATAMAITGVNGTVAWNAATRTLSLQPSQALEPGKTYQVNVGAPLADFAGNPLKQHAFSFATSARRTLRVALEPGAQGLALAGDLGQSAPVATLALVGVGLDPVVISKLTLTGANAGLFQIKEQTCTGASVTASASCFVSITAQNSTSGQYLASLVIDSDATNGPVTIPLVYSAGGGAGSVGGAAGAAGTTGLAGVAGASVGVGTVHTAGASSVVAAAGTPSVVAAAGMPSTSPIGSASGAASLPESDGTQQTQVTCTCRAAGYRAAYPSVSGLAGLLALCVLRLRRRRD